YQVKDTSDGAVRALKLLPFQFLSDQKMIQRFRYEAKQSRGFDHPNITRVYDYGEDLVDHYLVMELAQGWAAPGGHIALDVGELPKPLDVPAVLSIVKQACEGLDYIHRQQVIHRDVKPGNLLLFEDGWVKLADFGVARSRESITLTMTGLAMGTPEYMSPEQAEGKRDLTPASDIYSLGVVIYELLTGATPFKRATPLATAIAHLRDPVPAPTRLNPSIPEPLQKIVLKCLEKKPPHRFQTARELYHALAAYESTGRWEPLAGAGTTDDATDGALDTETEEGASVLERPPARPQVRDGAVGERPDNSERRNTAHTSDLTVPLWRNRRVAAAAALVALVCLSILGRFLWRLYSPPDSLVYEAKWQPNDDTLNLIVNDLRTKPLSIDQYQLRSNQFEHLLEVHICFDNDNGALYNTETNLFIKVFVSPGGEGGGQFSAHWLMTSRVTPEGDPRKIWHRKELRSETITFPIAPTSARDNIETLIEKIGPPPQEILDYLRERVGIAYSEIRPQVFLGVERRQWVLLPESGNFRVLLQCTRVHAMPYTREWLAKLGPVADIPTTPLDNRWKWNELEIVEEGDGPREGERRFTERVKPFER
ncbi:MAG TPA: serine/threonine-protein kinase, partial [Pyrinomonadaceae bacterium]|nr:serine/threonine-protein kinase [Pyrinomonadaceae bacterium]